MNLGARVRQARKAIRRSQRSVARELRLSHQFVGEIERGRVKLPRARVRDFEHTLGLERDTLLKVWIQDELEELDQKQRELRRELGLIWKRAALFQEQKDRIEKDKERRM